MTNTHATTSKVPSALRIKEKVSRNASHGKYLTNDGDNPRPLTIRPQAGSAEDLHSVGPIQSEVIMPMYQTTDSVYTPTLGEAAAHKFKPERKGQEQYTKSQRHSRS